MHTISLDVRDSSNSFENHLEQCEEILLNNEPSERVLETVVYHTKAVVSLVTQELPPLSVTPGLGATELHPARLGQYLSALVENRLFDKLLIWVEGRPCPGTEKAVRIRDIQRTHLLTLFEDLMTQSLQHVLYESSILRPLLQFIFKLSSQLKPAYEQSYGRTLYELCVLLCRDSSLLAVCRKLSDELFEQPHLVFTLLVPLIHRADSVGDHAKDAFLLALSLSKIDESLSSYLAFESDFCPVLAAGLGALYSSLPKKLIPRHSFRSHDAESPGGPVIVSTSAFLSPHTSTPCIVELPVGGAAWHQLSDIECNQSTDLRRFLHTLDFCNLVMKISHPSVREQLLHFINSGFLIPVLGSALHQSALDEVVAATAYLELFLRRLTDPLLLKLFLRFIVTSNHDSYPILTSLINRLNANAALGMVTLSLFRTILSFHCEDVMYELIFKHLGPLYHLQPPQSRKISVKENFHVKSSRLLSPSRQDSVTRTHHPPLSELALSLVRSGDNFLALATTAGPDLRHAAKMSEACSRYSLRNGESVQTPTARVQPPSSDGVHTQTQVSDDRNASGSSSNSQEADWVLVNNAYATFAAPETPFLYPYLRSAFSRIHRRIGACQAWSSKYFPLSLSDGVTDTFLSEKDLEEFEVRNQQELQTTPTKLASQPFKPPASSRGSSIENHVTDDFRSSPLLPRSRVRASSLYQLNYICDLSDDDSAVDYGKPEVFALSTDPSNSRGDIPETLSENLVDTFDSKPSNDYPVPDDVVCTCLPNPSVECLSYEGSDEDDADSSMRIDELNSFLTALDHVSSPWDCSLHFSHLPSCSTLPPIDPEFLQELDIPGEAINPVLSPKPRDSLLSSEHQTLCSGVCTQAQSPTSSSAHTYTSDPSHPVRNKSPIAGGIGPFLSILLNRLSNLHTNCFFTNLLLTDLIAALAAYPCPLLYNYLLNSVGLALKSNANSVSKVLHTVRSQLVVTSASVENWHSLVYRARVYLNCGRPYATDTVIDPDFYSTEHLNQQNGSSVSPSTSHSGSSRRSASIDRPSLRPLNETRTVWLPSPGNITTGDIVDLPTASFRFSCAIDPLVLTVRPWTNSNFIMPLFPVDQYPAKRSRSDKRPGRTSLPSFSTHRLTSFWGSTSGLPSGHVAFKQLWPRSAQKLTTSSPILKSKRSQPVRSSADSDSNEDDPTEPEISTRVRNLVFGAVIFDEFCYELAALCYLHSMHADVFSPVES
ncbi:hypothetical protein CRM22_007048 [Opisthorchis felineus]|uniref:FHF complex subunit HOOK-interacting protein C-terminal domain-containing protein n=1 Tax=Opisthorchis felineus TaxID=147828 RepID=A0A4S2LR24_OPIFE|nr:hypothetical protein CRM22_007048 [Opisthorchis felineus]